jgi:hypothetical protein
MSASATSGDALIVATWRSIDVFLLRKAQTNAGGTRTPDDAEELVAFGADAEELLRIVSTKRSLPKGW